MIEYFGSIEEADPALEDIHFIGTWLYIAEKSYPDMPSAHERVVLKRLQEVDSEYGYICVSGLHNGSVEKGVDTHLINHLIDSVHYKRVDSCIIVSDNVEYVPIIKELRNHYPQTHIYHAGFEKNELRATTYSYIPLEKKFDEIFN